MGFTQTTNLSLKKPEHADPQTYDNWDAVINDNMDTIDVAFGPRSYSEQNYISNLESHSASLDALDVALQGVEDITTALDIVKSTSDQKDALAGEGSPSSANKYVTHDYIIKDRKEFINPEYPGAVFTIGEGGGENIGTLISDKDVQNNFFYNYYKWVSSETDALQIYDIVLQWKVPETFEEFATQALTVDICSQENASTNNKLDVILSKDGVATISSDTGNYGTAITWKSEREGSEEVSFPASDTVLNSLSAGDILNIVIRLYSKNSKYIKVGAISIFGAW